MPKSVGSSMCYNSLEEYNRAASDQDLQCLVTGINVNSRIIRQNVEKCTYNTFIKLKLVKFSGWAYRG